jgi:hypothetical protein
MNGIAAVFLLVNAVALFALPLRLAAFPLLVGACYMTLAQGLEIGPFNFPVIRILIAVGVMRVVLCGQWVAGRINALDKAVIAWAAWMLISSLMHNDPASTLVNRLGMVYNACGFYFLLRVFCRGSENVEVLARMTALILIPLALEMVFERNTGRNLFAVLGGVNEWSEIRNGVVRAQGPFAHPILAGSVGAATMPLVLVLWRNQRAMAVAGLLACGAIVVASASSGPMLSLIFSLTALMLWPWRSRMRWLRWAAVLGYVALDIVMNAPAYFTLARIDMTGSSTGWHRAELIDAAVKHVSEWWMFGTDYTRHWMWYGVGWSNNHIDITNFYINMGVYGGLLLMFLFMRVLWKGFVFVGATCNPPHGTPAPGHAFMMWAMGSSLFAHAVTFISVSYFDQSVLFLYLTLAAICGGRESVPVPLVPLEPVVQCSELTLGEAVIMKNGGSTQSGAAVVGSR